MKAILESLDSNAPPRLSRKWNPTQPPTCWPICPKNGLRNSPGKAAQERKEMVELLEFKEKPQPAG